MEEISFELWDVSTRNVITAFEDEAAALAAVQDAVVRHGRDFVQSWALIRDSDDETALIAEGPELIQRALTGWVA
jgi:hypothetical protein